MKTRVAVMFGGKSVEHEVSIISGIQALMSMDREKYDIIPVYITKKNEMYIGDDIGKIDEYKNIDALLRRSSRAVIISENGKAALTVWPPKKFGKNPSVEFDIAFPIVHGTNVEDGTLQGYLKTLGVPFVGCDVTASALGMDKYASKAVVRENGIPALDSLLFSMKDYQDVEDIVRRSEERFGYPVIVKPYNTGSSVGIAVAKGQEELIRAVDDAFLYARKIIVEHAIMNLREINCSVLGDDTAAEASVCEEPMHTKDILSYEDKYLGSSKNGASKGMAGVSRQIPAAISEELTKQIQDYAVRAFQCLGCAGVARMDFMLDGDNGQVYFNEINTIPGSLSFYLWEPAGVPYRELLDRMIQLGLKRAREEESLTFTFDTNILNRQSLSGVKEAKV